MPSWEVRLRRKGGKILPALATFLAATRESGEQSRRDTRRSGAGGSKGGGRERKDARRLLCTGCVCIHTRTKKNMPSWEVRLRRKGGKILPALATFLAATRESGEQSRRDTRRSGAGGCKGGEK